MLHILIFTICLSSYETYFYTIRSFISNERLEVSR